METWLPPISAWPDYGPEFDTRITPFASGREKRKQVRSTALRVGVWEGAGLTTAEKEAIEAFYIARGGQFEAFKFTPAEGVEGTYRFGSTPRIRAQGYGVWTVSVELREVND